LYRYVQTNTSVYVSGLPDDCDAEEVKEVFSKVGLCTLNQVDP
jgi:RNA recognition motif-containing protein